MHFKLNDIALKHGEMISINATTGAGMSYFSLSRGLGKSHLKHAMKLHVLKERQQSNSPDLFWFDEMNYHTFFWDGKFRKLFSNEVLDKPEVPAVEWATFNKEEMFK